MSTSTVQVGYDSIRTTMATIDSDITDGIKIFLSNYKNEKKIIGLDAERSTEQINRSCLPESKLVILQLCDGDNCLIIQLPYFHGNKLPVSLTNFLNLPDFTFMGIGINKTLKMLKKQWGLTCKNAVDVGPLSWASITKNSEDKRLIFHQFVSVRKPTSAIFEEWNSCLNEDQIKLATANAYFAFKVGDMILENSLSEERSLLLHLLCNCYVR